MANIPVKANKSTVGGANDKVYTPENIAKQLIAKLPIKSTDTILDPCKGGGAFYDNYPSENTKYYCEIDEGKDFFDFNTKVDWIISNPPYSIYDKFVEHCFELSDNVCLLVPFSKISNSMGRIKQIKKFGGIKKIWFVPASKCGFPFGFPCAFVWFKKDCEDNWEIV